MDKNKILKRIQHGLIVSCQALNTEPLYSPFIMSRMALAAYQGGAVGIRANGPADIREIKNTVDLPVIGLFKVEYPDSEVYITPTIKEIDELMAAGPEIIAMDATNRPRPEGQSLEELFGQVREKYPGQLFMADTSCYEEGIKAKELGFDIVGTTMSGYTEYTKELELPNYKLIKQYVDTLEMPVIAEGGIWTPEQLKTALDLGVWAAVVGTAITRPKDITERFVSIISKK